MYTILVIYTTIYNNDALKIRIDGGLTRIRIFDSHLSSVCLSDEKQDS